MTPHAWKDWSQPFWGPIRISERSLTSTVAQGNETGKTDHCRDARLRRASPLETQSGKLHLVAAVRRRRRTLCAGLPRYGFITAFALALSSVALASQAEVAPLSGRDDPAILTLQGLSGNPQSLEHYRGQIVVLNFWATWCVPCREEMPIFVRAREHYQARDVEVIGASADDASTGDHIEPFINEYEINFPIWLGATIRDMERLGLGATLPATAFIDRDGRVVARILGPIEEHELIERIDWLLGDRTGEPPRPLVNRLETPTDEHGHHEGEEEHQHAAVAMEGASLVPS